MSNLRQAANDALSVSNDLKKVENYFARHDIITGVSLLEQISDTLDDLKSFVKEVIAAKEDMEEE